MCVMCAQKHELNYFLCFNSENHAIITNTIIDIIIDTIIVNEQTGHLGSSTVGGVLTASYLLRHYLE